MTIAEIIRAIESFNRVNKDRLKEKASYDYILANLITRGFAISMGSKQPFPTIEEVYPNLFTNVEKVQQQKIQEQKNNLSTLRFLQFAQSYNQRFKKQEVPKEDK